MSNYELIDFTSKDVVVSIAMLAYNHENCIAEALESVLMQKTQYNYVIVIAEDKSTDNTRQIILEYHKKYPEKIKLILQNENVGASKNNISLLENLEGKYMAALEGDDYWIDPLKLEKQIAIMEAKPEVVLTFTSRFILESDLTKTESLCQDRFWTKNDIYAYGSVFPAQTMLGRNYKLELVQFISLFPNSFGNDKIIGYFYCLKGKVQSISDITAVYRHNGLGVWSRFSKEEKVVLHIDESLKFITAIAKEKIDESASLEELKQLLFVRIINNNLQDIAFLKFLFKKYKLSNKLKLITIGNRVKLEVKKAVKTIYK